LPVEIRRGERSDLPALRTIECTVFEFEQLSERAFRRFLQLPGADLVVAVLAGEVVGYGLASYRKDSRRGHLSSLAVITRATARGIGMALLDELKSRALTRGASALRLEVRSDNAAAISLYTRAGYRPIGKRAFFYADFCDAVVYELPLDANP
jgi:CRISPR-associated Cas5-like protein